jgi:hypothetical protein
MLQKLLKAMTFSLLVGAAACSTADSIFSSESGDLRALEAGVDIDVPLIQDFPADPNPPAAFTSVASWSLNYVAYRDPSNTSNPDPTDPFNGFFLIANDSSGTPLFFDAIALTGEGVAHFVFSFQTDDAGSYLEIPLVAASDDPNAADLVNATVGWLMSEKTRVGLAIQSKYSAGTQVDGSAVASQSLSIKAQSLGFRTESLTDWENGLQCAADLAVLGLTITNPVAFFAAEAAVDGTFAVVNAVSGTGGTEQNVGGAIVNASLAGVAKGVGSAVTKAVASGAISSGTVSALKLGGGAVALVGAAGAVGYQVYKNGIKAGLQTAIDAVVPQSCIATYKDITQVPQVAVPSVDSGSQNQPQDESDGGASPDGGSSVDGGSSYDDDGGPGDGDR